MELTLNEQLIQQMYIAYYQRPADPEGLQYWVDQIEANGSWEAVSAAFGAPENEESSALYGDKTREEVVSELYQSAFNRSAVQDELDFWVESEFSNTDLAFAIINGAQNEDLETVNNKVEFSAELASQLGDNAAYAELAAATDVKALIAGITKDSTVTAESVTQVLEDNGVAPSQPEEPITYSLAASSEQINEGASNTFTVTSSKPVEEDTEVTFNLVVDGESASLDDFNAGAFNPVTVTIPAGETEATFDVESIAADGTEASETYRVEAVINGETYSTQVTLLDGAEGAGQTFQLTKDLDIIPGMNGSNGNSVTSGNDTIIGTVNIDNSGANPVDNSTLNAVDQIDAGDGTDTLRVIGGSEIKADSLPNYSDVEILNLSTAGTADLTQDTTAQAGLELLKVTAAGGDIDLHAADTQNVDVAGAKGAVDIDGGQNVVVNDATAGNGITIGAATVNNGTIEVTDAKLGKGSITTDGGTDVTVDATSEVSSTAQATEGTIDVGQGGDAGDEPTGAINVTQNLDTDGVAAFQGGDITTTGGSTVDVTVNANSVAEADDSDADTTVGAITVNGGDNTTDVTVTQNDNAEQFTSEDEGGRVESASVKFGAMKDGETLEIAGLTFEASKDLTAEDVAQAFSNLTATDTQSAGGPVENGFFTGTVDGNWTSGEANGDTVVFTSTQEAAANGTKVGDLDAANYTDTNIAEAARRPDVTTTQGQDLDNASATSGNAVVFGAVDVADGGDASIANVNIDGFANGSTVASDALESLTLRNNTVDANLTVTTAATALNLTLDGISSSDIGTTESVIDLDNAGGNANITNLTLTTEGSASAAALTGAAVTDLTVNAGADLNVAGNATDLDALVNATITGDAAVNLGDISAANLDSFDASANTGGVAATVSTTSTGDIEEFAFSAGDDVVTLADVDMTVTVDAGAGTDRVVSTSALLSGNEEDIAAGQSNFEQVEVSDQVDVSGGDVVIDMSLLGFDYIVTNGTDAATNSVTGNLIANSLQLNKLSNNSTVVLAGAQVNSDATGTDLASIEASIADADTNASDVLNVVVETQDDATDDQVTQLDAGTLVANDIESVNIESATADEDGGDNVLTLDADSAANLVVTGSGDLDLTTTSTVLETVDASALTGDLAYTADQAEVEVTGGAGDDALVADANDVVLTGGAGDDTLTVNASADRVELFGGEGADTFVIGGPSTSDSTYAIIRDAEAGDTIKMSTLNNGQATSFKQAEVTLSEGATESTQALATQAVKDLGVGEMGWFQFGGNTFIVADDANEASEQFQNGTDSIVMLSGLYDLSQASFNDNGTLEIA